MSIILPKLVITLTHNFEAWIVGSAADPEVNNPRDFDVIVPYSQWQAVFSILPRDVKVNSFGVWKCISDGKEVSVWPGEMGWLMQRPKSKYVWYPATGVRYVCVSELTDKQGIRS